MEAKNKSLKIELCNYLHKVDMYVMAAYPCFDDPS